MMIKKIDRVTLSFYFRRIDHISAGRKLRFTTTESSIYESLLKQKTMQISFNLWLLLQDDVVLLFTEIGIE